MMVRFLMHLSICLALFSACSEPVPEQLEGRITLLEGNDVNLGDDLIKRTGIATIEFVNDAWVVDIASSPEPCTATLHSPGKVDLSRFSGDELTLTVSSSWRSYPAVVLSNASQVIYVAGGLFDALITDQFGPDFVDWGEAAGSENKDGYRWTYHAVQFQTDAGQIELLPGDAQVHEIDGQLWRIVVVTAYQTEWVGVGPQVSCGGPGILLDFEMELMEAAIDDELLTRPEGLEPAIGGCGG